MKNEDIKKPKMIDLGVEDKYDLDYPSDSKKDKNKKKISYPSFCIRNVPELLDEDVIPDDDEFYILCKVEKTGFSKRPSWRNSEDKEVEVTFSVKAMAPIGVVDTDNDKEKGEKLQLPIVNESTIDDDLKEFLSK
jgi:hypothetical protein